MRKPVVALFEIVHVRGPLGTDKHVIVRVCTGLGCLSHIWRQTRHCYYWYTVKGSSCVSQVANAVPVKLVVPVIGLRLTTPIQPVFE